MDSHRRRELGQYTTISKHDTIDERQGEDFAAEMTTFVLGMGGALSLKLSPFTCCNLGFVAKYAKPLHK